MTTFRLLVSIIAISAITSGVFAQDKTNPDRDKKIDKGAATTATTKEELARVVILPFMDRTNSKNFQYMSESLSEAIHRSMLKNFSYNKVDDGNVKKAEYEADQLLKKSKINGKRKPGTIKRSAKEGVEKKVKTEAEVQFDDDQLFLAEQIAKNTKSDIVIYGNYNYDNTTNELVFSVTIFLAASGEANELDETRNVVDVTIFKATDLVAKNLVDTINVMADEASGKKTTVAEGKTDGKKDDKPAEKKALTKKIGQAPVVDWAAKKFLINLGMGTSLIPAKNTDNLKPVQYEINIQNLSLRFWPVKSIQLTLKFNHINLGSNNTMSHANLDLLDLMLFGGYGLYFEKRLYVYGDLGAGYYYGNFDISTYGGSGSNSAKYIVKNPAFGARVGLDLLLASFLSAGMNMTYQMYYDKPNPVHNLSLMINMGVTF